MMDEQKHGAVASTDTLGPMYAERDCMAQGKHYTDHIMAMTAEGLHSKSDIAAELAHRDIEIERLRADVARKSYAKTRAEAVAYTCRQLEEGPTSREKNCKSHYGKQELRELLDFIYGGVPKNDSERLV